MALNSKYLKLVIKTLAQKLFEDEDSRIRGKAAESLGSLGSEEAIEPLCQALEKEKDSDVKVAIMEAMVLIHNPKSVQTMSDSPKNVYNFNAPVNTSAVNVENDQYNNPPPKTPAEAAKEIQDLLTQLKQDNPDFSEERLIEQVIANNPTLKARLINALKEGGTEALKVFFPFVSIPVETIRGFLET